MKKLQPVNWENLETTANAKKLSHPQEELLLNEIRQGKEDAIDQLVNS